MTSVPQAGSPMSSEQNRQTADLISLAKTRPGDLPPELLDLAKKEQWKLWATDFNAKYVKMKTARAPFERQWYINLAFVNGKQYVAPVEIPGQGFRLQTPRVPAHRVRMVVNKSRMTIRTETAKLSQQKPIPVVLPKTSEDEDFNAAEIAELILKNEFGRGEFNKTYRSWIWWGAVTGTSFLKQYWNPSVVDENAQPEPQVLDLGQGPVIDPNSGQPIVMQQEVKGKILVDRITPWHIFVPDLLEETIDAQPYVMHVMTRTQLWVETNFGFTPECDARSTSTLMDAAFILTKGAGDSLNDSVTVKEVWIKPGGHKDFPKGGVLTIIGNRCVQVLEDWPWPFKEYPFYKYDGIATGGFYGDSILVDIIPLQKEYNKTRSQMIEIKNTMGKPRVAYQRGSLDPRRISSEPGSGVEYLPGYNPPIPLPAAEIPATMPMELDRLNSDWDDISGQHEITRGNNPSQVTSGTAISFLQEQDDTKLSNQVAGIEHAIERLGSHYLKLVSKFWDQPRIVKVVGKDNNVEAMSWQGSDLKGNTDVIVQSGSALPMSKAALQAMITEFMQNGWIDPASGMEIMQMGAFSKALDELLVDKKQANRENLKLSKLTPQDLQPQDQPAVGPDGQPYIDPATGEPAMEQKPAPLVILANSWDNHEMHIFYHNQFRKTQEFELLPQEVKIQFEQHVQMHQFALMSTMINASGQAIPGTGQDPAMQDPNADPALGGQAQ